MFEWNQSFTLTQKWIEVSSPVPHFLQVGLLLSPILYRCLLKVLCPVSRPITTLDCVLSKDKSLVFAAGLRPEIISRACLWMLPRPRHLAKCCFSIRLFIFLLIFSLETPKKGSGPTNRWTEPSLASLSAISYGKLLIKGIVIFWRAERRPLLVEKLDRHLEHQAQWGAKFEGNQNTKTI